jgi:hypothetical protein
MTEAAIRSEANLADAPSRQRGLDMLSLQQPTQQEIFNLAESTLGSQVCTDPFACKQGAVAPRFATPLHCRHSSLSLQRLAPRLVTARYTVGKSAMASTDCPKFWKNFERQGQKVFSSTRTVDYVEANLVFVEPRYEVLDLGHECWAFG